MPGSETLTTTSAITKINENGPAEGGLPLRVITPYAGSEAMRGALRSLLTGFSQARSLAWRFFLRDMQAEHRQSLLGYVWLVVPPLANTLVWVFLNGNGVIKVDSGPVPYPVFMLCGTILWAAFNSSIMAMLGAISSARGILAKVNFPNEALIYSAFLRSAIDAGLASLLLLPALLLFGVPLGTTMLLFPVALLGNLLVGAAIGLAILPLAALYSDIGRAVQLVLRFGFFLTPIIFTLPAEGRARQLFLLNPVTPMIVSGRAWLTGSNDAMPGSFALILAASLLIVVAGLIVYKIAMPHLVERLSA